MSRHSLKGRSILVTRAEVDAGSLVAALEAQGTTVIRLPLIEILPPESWSEIDASINSDRPVDWLVFTSRHGVRAFGRRLAELGKTISDLGDPKMAAVGRATAGAVSLAGWSVDLIPDKKTGTGVAEALRLSGVGPGSKIVMPRASEARPELPAILRQAGANVQDVAVYRTQPLRHSTESIDQIIAKKPDAILLASPSTVQSLGVVATLRPLETWKPLPVLVSIGPVTSDAIRSLGWIVAAEAESPGTEELVSAAAKALVNTIKD
ncbi:MAG: uroporphyrinogen-III synthase [Candidatus Latescibacteria bacterium]|jgi:uroporphyrinogen-III synthase|nr:uroporphyrinogen-III synthase [Candidatus Latescibacterota bacterium]